MLFTALCLTSAVTTLIVVLAVFVVLLAVFFLSVSLLQAPVSAGGVDRHIFDGHVGNLAKQLSVGAPPSVQHSENQVCFDSILDKLEQISFAV